MARSSSPTKPTLGQNFWMKWILGNSLGYGVGLSLPILLADLLSAPSYTKYAVLAFLSFGIWVGLAQWLVIRQAIPITAWWILACALSPLLSLAIVVPLVLISPPLSFLLIGIYPLLTSLSQWGILRQVVQPSWRWIITSVIATVLGGAVGWIFGMVSSNQWLNQPGVSTLIGGICYGLVYSLIASVGIKHLNRQEYRLPSPKKKSGLDIAPNSRFREVQVIIILVYFIVLVAWLNFLFPDPSVLFKSINGSLPVWFEPICFLIYFFVYNYLSILVHELGHFLLAWSNKFDLKIFAIGRWVLMRRGKSLKFCRTCRPFAGGFVSSIPKSIHDLNKRLFMKILGGPLASFLLFCVGTLPLLFQSSVGEPGMIRFITFLSIISLYAAVLNIIPFRVGYLNTDGRRMLDLFQNNLHGQRFAAIYGVDASLRQGIRPRDIEPELINRVLAIPEKSMDHISGLIMAYYVALDKGEFDQAGHYLDQALDIHLHYPEIFRGTLLLEGAYFEANIRHRFDLARRWFEKVQDKTLVEPYTVLRAEAALLLAEGNKEVALIKAEQGLFSAQRDQFMIGSAMAETDWLQALLQKMG